MMALDKDLLAILCCPETKQAVTLADAVLIQRLNEAIKDRRLQNKGKQAVTEPVEAGLLRADAKILYPIRENIPVMLIEEGIPLEQVDDPGRRGAGRRSGQCRECVERPASADRVRCVGEASPVRMRDACL